MYTEAKWEFIDHPADIQLHAWGPQPDVTLEQLGKAFFEVMFETDNFKEETTHSISVKGKDAQNLLYNFLDEWLYVFDAEDFVATRIKVTKCDFVNLEIEATGYGELFDMKKHADFRRTEVKAITYASMKVDTTPGASEFYVILDL
ncbi:archease, putative [Trichomonas vaginalis G3]|uniref:Protein archease-like n=1 Tax=Trichomonas vaginalis (strain ATCC PRA-98 / G3) TaxID=412133 RepID=A2F1C4_TRIV3|nr:zinc finger and BTB domain containing 8 opposite strand [Trichomonas vaginalis G3]EAY01288.1 archease, putative [Trichomonas vaginalis G3]KAI5542816.1 zinc finger and BTB domain containing 8 opposite strand [Trichomonas vaginalis G3]|eukprot:XP_001314095.1 archease [Trichomonas vaginalis G3]